MIGRQMIDRQRVAAALVVMMALALPGPVLGQSCLLLRPTTTDFGPQNLDVLLNVEGTRSREDFGPAVRHNNTSWRLESDALADFIRSGSGGPIEPLWLANLMDEGFVADTAGTRLAQIGQEECPTYFFSVHRATGLAIQPRLTQPRPDGETQSPALLVRWENERGPATPGLSAMPGLSRTRLIDTPGSLTWDAWPAAQSLKFSIYPVPLTIRVGYVQQSEEFDEAHDRRRMLRLVCEASRGECPCTTAFREFIHQRTCTHQMARNPFDNIRYAREQPVGR